MITQEILEKLLLSGALKEKESVHNLKGGKGKITIYKDAININATESGYILLEPGSNIGFHYHYKNSEIYRCMFGAFESNGSVYSAGQTSCCSLHEGHDCKNIADNITIIRYFKK